MHTLQSIIARAFKRSTPEPLRSTKAAIAICAALLSFFSFAGHVKVFSYASDHSSSSALTFSGVSPENFALPFYNNTFGLCVRGIGASAATARSLVLPSPTADSLTNRNSDISFPVSFSDANIGNLTVWNGISYSPALSSLFSFAVSVISSGYSGSGLYDLGGSTLNHYYNFDYKTVVGNILSSTNNVYRALLLNHLSQIQSSVVNIGTGVSALVPSVDRIADINSSLFSDYRAVNDSYLNPSYSNIAARASYFNGLGGYGLDFDNYLSNNPERAPEIAKAVLENARKNIGYVLNACRDPDSPFYGHSLQDVLDSPDDFERAISAGGGGSVVSQFANDVERARQAGENFNNSVNSRLDEIGASISGSPNSDAPSIMGLLGGGGSVDGGIAGDIKRLSTNDWASAVTNQLAENVDAIKEQLRNMFGPVTNDVRESSEVIKDELPGLNNYISQIDASSRSTSESVNGIQSHLENGVVKVDVVGADIGFTLDAPLTIESDQWTEISIPLSGIEGRLNRWYDDWTSFWDPDDEFRRWPSFYDMVGRIEAGLTNLVSTNEWDRYYFERFKRADTFRDNDDQSFKIDDACDLIFGNGFDIGEYDKLNWFSRVELLLYKFSSVTNTFESTDITSVTNEVNTLNFNVTNFVNTSIKVVGVFKLIDGFAKSMRSAFSGYSSPQTSGVVLLEAGHWIGDESLVLKVPVEVQNALRLVFECIWYLSAFVIGWRILVWSWDKIVSMIRWLWSLIDI